MVSTCDHEVQSCRYPEKTVFTHCFKTLLIITLDAGAVVFLGYPADNMDMIY